MTESAEQWAIEARATAAGRMDRMEKSIDDFRIEQVSQGKTLAQIVANTSPLPELHRRIRETEMAVSKVWTVLEVTWAIVAALLGATWVWKH
jgi:protoporphyrinogen oxidase